MPTFHGEPNRSVPNSHLWFSVATPSNFVEYKLPASKTDWTRADKAKYAELKRLADIYAVPIFRKDFRTAT